MKTYEIKNITMKYSEYKNNVEWCKTGEYNKETKEIEVFLHEDVETEKELHEMMKKAEDMIEKLEISGKLAGTFATENANNFKAMLDAQGITIDIIEAGEESRLDNIRLNDTMQSVKNNTKKHF